VSKVDAVTVHHRAPTSDHADIVLTAVLDCPRGDTRSFSYGFVHPNATDPGIAAVAHDPVRDLRTRDDHHSVDPIGDSLQVRITAIALEGLHVRINWEYIVSGSLEPVID
jgi:hypothetical protein